MYYSVLSADGDFHAFFLGKSGSIDGSSMSCGCILSHVDGWYCLGRIGG